MLIRAYGVALVAAVAVAIGCESRGSLPASPSSSDRGNTMSIASPGGAPQSIAGHQHAVTLVDACDPKTFPDGLCVGPGGGITFQHFLDELTNHQSVGAWRMAPGEFSIKVGDVLAAVNQGGEQHTFTEVDEFGGGINAVLNQLSGNPIPAPECNENTIEKLDPGERSEEVENDEGVEKYQCCIHPWMRTIVHIVEK
jgi:plastocyanin